jgi:TRAP-type C4-dicarboxylate transport system permease small subunit
MRRESAALRTLQIEMRRFTQALARIEDLFAEAAIAILVLCAVSICIDVVMRYFVGRPIMGSTELTEYALVYITFLGAAWAVPRGAHIDIDAFVIHMPESVQKLCALLGNVVSFAVALALTFFGAWTTWTAYTRHLFKPTLLEVPTWIVLIVIPVGSIILALRYFVEVTLTVQAIATHAPMVKRERGPTID